MVVIGVGVMDFFLSEVCWGTALSWFTLSCGVWECLFVARGRLLRARGCFALCGGFLYRGMPESGRFSLGSLRIFGLCPTIVRLLSVECRKLIIAVVTHQWSGVLNNVCRSFTGFQGVQGSRSRLGGGFWTLRSAGVQSRSGWRLGWYLGMFGGGFWFFGLFFWGKTV